MINFEPTEDWPQTVYVGNEPMTNQEVIANLRAYASIKVGDPIPGWPFLFNIQKAALIAADILERRQSELSKEIDWLKAQEEFHTQSS